MMENWKDIIGFEGKYQVSDCGRVKSLNYGRMGKERILKQSCKAGYLSVGLCKRNKVKWYLVHRLVADAFIPNSSNLPQVNHKDECKTNNVVTNLEWCDCKYNNNYGTCRARMVAAQSKRVYQYTKEGEFVGSYPSAIEAERRTGIGHISECCNGKLKSSHGFIWSYTPINNQRINLF